MTSKRKKILIVDDSKVVRSMVRRALLTCSVIQADLIMAESYEETKKIIQKTHFHVAILDVTLQDAPNGEVIDLLIQQNIPVIVLTSGMYKVSKNLILEKDIVDYIIKSNPQSLNYIVMSVKRVLYNYDAYVLVVDDSNIMRLHTRQNLEKLHLNVIEAKNAKEAIDILHDSQRYIPLIITDYEMQEMNGMELTMELRQTFTKDRLSIIAINNSENSKVATEFLKHGANDCIKKSYSIEELKVRINANLELIDLFRQGKEAANKDFLTGMYNRRFFFESGVPILEKARRKKINLAVVMIDIDFFKKINDKYGHNIGDIAIKEVSLVLNNFLRNSDLISRFGGEEFCILIDDISIKDLRKKFESIRSYFEQHTIITEKHTISYTVSIGIFYGLLDSLEEMIMHSDKALYEAKETGRNKVVIHTPKSATNSTNRQVLRTKVIR